MNHGHVTPNPDGNRARCGGPGFCKQCSEELAQKMQSDCAAENARKKQVDDLAMLVRRLAHSLDKPSGNTLLAREAMDYLRRHGLQGSPLR